MTIAQDEGADAAPRDPDPHGQAALLLIESLIHGLIARRILSGADASEIIEIATEVKIEVAAEYGERRATLERSLGLLRAMSASLRSER